MISEKKCKILTKRISLTAVIHNKQIYRSNKSQTLFRILEFLQSEEVLERKDYNGEREIQRGVRIVRTEPALSHT